MNNIIMSRLYFFVICIIRGVSEIKAQNIGINTSSGISSFDFQMDYYQLLNISYSSCDLTEEFCDPFCCDDRDCSEWQYQNFLCYNVSKDSYPDFSYFDCGCESPEKPGWFVFLCKVYTNPIYLGTFHKISHKIESKSVLKKLIDKKKYIFTFHIPSYRKAVKGKSVDHYSYGSPIKTYFIDEKLSHISYISSLIENVPVRDSTFVCKRSTVKFKVNNLSSCISKINVNLCEKGQLLGVSQYLVVGKNFTQVKAPFIFKRLDFLESSNIYINVKCISLKKKYFKFGNKNFLIFYPNEHKPCESNKTAYDTFWSADTCYNVLFSMSKQFIINGSDISRVEIDYTVANVHDSTLGNMINNQNGNVKNKTFVYLKQIFYTSFIDLENSENKYTNFNNSALINRGYFIGEKLNFGYKR